MPKPIPSASVTLVSLVKLVPPLVECHTPPAVVSGLTSLAGGASTWYELGPLNRVIIDMVDGYLLVTSISSGSVLGVIADRSANLSTLAYEMTLFANRAGGALTPRLIVELKNSIQS